MKIEEEEKSFSKMSEIGRIRARDDSLLLGKNSID